MIVKRIAVLIGASVALNAIAAEPPAAPPDRSPSAASAGAQERPPAQANAEAATPPAAPKTDADPAVRQTTARADRLDLDTTVVTGNRELPKVLYIVPWKKADLGELPAQPFNTLLDEVLTPVDRDVFRREVTYYEAVSGTDDAAAASPAAPAARPEK